MRKEQNFKFPYVPIEGISKEEFADKFIGLQPDVFVY